ncbi:MAG: rod-binding protein [Parvularculaceae bacterium]|nr:rod-binding protein [Parvularculaceae bacterium]
MLTAAARPPAEPRSQDFPPSNAQRADEIKSIAAEFEAVFIAEMLSHAGFEKALASDAGFGGEAMSGMLLEKYAEMIAKRGGFGVAALIERQIASRPVHAK